MSKQRPTTECTLSRQWVLTLTLALLFIPGCSGCQQKQLDEVPQDTKSPTSSEPETPEPSRPTDETEQSPRDSEPPGAAKQEPATTAVAAAGQSNGQDESSAKSRPPSAQHSGPVESAQRAAELERLARASARAGDQIAAYRQAAEALQHARRHPNDPACRSAAAGLAKYVEELSAGFQLPPGSQLGGKTLIER